MAPEMELFNRLYEVADLLGYQAYDHLPMKNEPVSYPFVVIGDVTTTTIPYKDDYGGLYAVTVDVWASGEDRLIVSQMMEGLSRLGKGFFYTQNYRFQGRAGQMQKRILTDTSVPDTILMHGFLGLVFKRV